MTNLTLTVTKFKFWIIPKINFMSLTMARNERVRSVLTHASLTKI